jgi:acetyl-CoA C-acetyltransferase
MTGPGNPQITKAICAANDALSDQKEGLIFPAGFALIARQYFKKYGATSNDLDLVSLKSHSNANLNETAHFFHKKVDLEMIKNSPKVCSPFKLFDCSPVSDGAAAVVLSSKKNSCRDIEIIGSAFRTDTISLAQRNDLTSFSAVRLAAADAYKQAGISPKDVSIAEVHDCFTISELVAMDDLGFCKPGLAKDLVRKNETALSGKIPIGTGGGLKAGGHPIGATGIAQIYELTTQLRGEAGSRQVDRAKIGLAHNIGGTAGSAAVHILKRTGD